MKPRRRPQRPRSQRPQRSRRPPPRSAPHRSGMSARRRPWSRRCRVGRTSRMEWSRRSSSRWCGRTGPACRCHGLSWAAHWLGVHSMRKVRISRVWGGGLIAHAWWDCRAPWDAKGGGKTPPRRHHAYRSLREPSAVLNVMLRTVTVTLPGLNHVMPPTAIPTPCAPAGSDSPGDAALAIPSIVAAKVTGKSILVGARAIVAAS